MIRKSSASKLKKSRRRSPPKLKKSRIKSRIRSRKMSPPKLKKSRRRSYSKLKKSRRRSRKIKRYIKSSIKFKFENDNIENDDIFYINNMNEIVTSIDLWVIRFMLRMNKLYCYGMLSPTNVNIVEDLINKYKIFLQQGEKDIDEMIENINLTVNQMIRNKKQIKFGMVITKQKKKEDDLSSLIPISQINSLTEFTDSIIHNDFEEDIKKRLKALGGDELKVAEFTEAEITEIENNCLESRMKELLEPKEFEKYERTQQVHEVILETLGDTQQTQEGISELKETQKDIIQSLQKVLVSQQNNTTILNNINSSVSEIRDKDKRSVKQKIINGISMGIVTSIKTSLKVTYMATIGMPWYAFKNYTYFTLGGFKMMFKPFIILLMLVCAVIQLGNICYILTLPYEELFVPDQFSGIKATYPLMQKSADRFSLVDQFKDKFTNQTYIIHGNFNEFKLHTEAGKLLKNMKSYQRFYHTSSPIPKLIFNEFYEANRLKQYYFFRGWHLLINLMADVKRPTKGYYQVIEEILNTGEYVEALTTSTYRTQKYTWDMCMNKIKIGSSYICGKEPVENTELFRKTDEIQKKYVEWEQCNDYNKKLNSVTKYIYTKDCGVKPIVYNPVVKFINKQEEKVYKFIYKKLSLWLDPDRIEKMFESYK